MALCSLSIASKEEEELLKQAIALSLEGAEDNDQDNSEQDAEEDGKDKEEERMLRQAIALSLEGAEESDNEEDDNNDKQEVGAEEEEELMLRQAIALSLEETEEEDGQEEISWTLMKPETMSTSWRAVRDWTQPNQSVTNFALNRNNIADATQDNSREEQTYKQINT